MLYVTLNNGVKMPLLGYGVYQVSKSECKRCVADALDTGYRLIDTAQSYFNESEVGDAICESGIPRNEIFLTTKVWIEHYGYDACRKSVMQSLEKLKTDYIDLCLLHQPFADIYGAYRALEDMMAEGRIRAIGISNFAPDRMVDIASFASTVPAVNQIEIHPHFQQSTAIEWNKKYGVAPQAWAPFGEGRNGMFDEPLPVNIGKKYGKTAAQVILRWHIQRGTAVIPKSTHIERMRENFDIFDFELNDAEMLEMTSLDKGVSSFFSHADPNMVEWFVKMVEQRKHNDDHTKEKKGW